MDGGEFGGGQAHLVADRFVHGGVGFLCEISSRYSRWIACLAKGWAWQRAGMSTPTPAHRGHRPVLSRLMLQRCWLIHTDTWAGSRAWTTTVAKSSRTEFRSTASFSRAANAATVLSAL